MTSQAFLWSWEGHPLKHTELIQVDPADVRVQKRELLPILEASVSGVLIPHTQEGLCWLLCAMSKEAVRTSIGDVTGALV